MQLAGCREVDRTAPEAELTGNYTIMQPREVSAKDLVKEIRDLSETRTGFLTIERLGDLRIMTEAELEAYAVSKRGALPLPADAKLKEQVQMTEEGIYRGQLGIEDESGNRTVLTHIFYVDDTPPAICGVVDQTITVSNEEGTFQVDGITVMDNLHGDIYTWDTSVLEILSNGDGTLEHESFTLRVHAEDLAGNDAEAEAQLQVYNTYHAEAVTALLEAQKRNAETEVSAFAEDGWDRAKAEEAFTRVNRKRQEHGIPELVWDEDLYALACVRAEEIVQVFSHESPSGANDGCAENIASNYMSIQNLVNAWMDSEGHRANILDARGVRGAVACYLYEGSCYWVQLFAM